MSGARNPRGAAASPSRLDRSPSRAARLCFSRPHPPTLLLASTHHGQAGAARHFTRARLARGVDRSRVQRQRRLGGPAAAAVAAAAAVVMVQQGPRRGEGANLRAPAPAHAPTHRRDGHVQRRAVCERRPRGRRHQLCRPPRAWGGGACASSYFPCRAILRACLTQAAGHQADVRALPSAAPPRSCRAEPADPTVGHRVLRGVRRGARVCRLVSPGRPPLLPAGCRLPPCPPPLPPPPTTPAAVSPPTAWRPRACAHACRTYAGSSCWLKGEGAVGAYTRWPATTSGVKPGVTIPAGLAANQAP